MRASRWTRLWSDERGFWNLLLPLLTGLGGVLGGASKARSEANQQQGQMALSQYNTELAGKIAEQSAQTNRARDVSTAGPTRLKEQILANMIQGWKPMNVTPNWSGKPQISGGMPSSFSPATQMQAGSMSRDALMRQLQGVNAPDITPPITLPNAPQMPRSGWLDKLLGIGGLIGGLAGAIPQKPKSPMPGTYVGPW